MSNAPLGSAIRIIEGLYYAAFLWSVIVAANALTRIADALERRNRAL